MCVTTSPATIDRTRTFVNDTTLNGEAVHVCGYQNEARNISFGPNCMLLNFAGRDLKLVDGPEDTVYFMDDMTRGLPELVRVPRLRSAGLPTKGGARVQEYGDYTVVLAQDPRDLLQALKKVRLDRRPSETPALARMVEFYREFYPADSFVLACFNGSVKPKHPITVSYKPNDPTVLTAPGLDGHDGLVPRIGKPMKRDFTVAFAIEGVQLPHPVRYSDNVAGRPWAPATIAGFVDNRGDGRNRDYSVPKQAVLDGLTGLALAQQLV